MASRAAPMPEPPAPPPQVRIVPLAAGAAFELGRTVMTPGIAELVESGDLNPAYILARHARGDWGDLGDGDRRRNDLAVRDGERILSAYDMPTGRVWVITDAVGDDEHRAVTTILLPEEY